MAFDPALGLLPVADIANQLQHASWRGSDLYGGGAVGPFCGLEG